jgi:hypothetical protein
MPVSKDMIKASQNLDVVRFRDTYKSIPNTAAIIAPTRAQSGTAFAVPSRKKGIKNTPHSATSRKTFHATLNLISLNVIVATSTSAVS